MGSQCRAVFGHVHVQKQRKSLEKKGGREKEMQRERETEGQKQESERVCTREKQILNERQPHETSSCSIWFRFHMKFD